MSEPDRVARVAMIARWKPVHLGHAAILEALVAHGERVTIGIGSSNKYDAQNPWTVAETREMLGLVLRGHDNWTTLEVPDLGHGPRWRAMVKELLGSQDVFVTANDYVRSLLESDYEVVHPLSLLSEESRVRVDGTMVRRAMARGDDWKSLVPPVVARFLDERGLVERFRREFGPATLALEGPAS